MKPTFTPTSKPTPQPIPYCNVQLVDGGGTVGRDSSDDCPNNPDQGRDDIIAADVTTGVGGTRCCSGTGNYDSFCSELCEMVSFDDAAAVCQENGMRLCTQDEIMTGLLVGSGCLYDVTYVWTADLNCACDIAKVDGGGIHGPDGGKCSAMPDQGQYDIITDVDPSLPEAGVRCCTDAGQGDSFCNGRCELIPLDDAAARCVAHGMRLCTQAEVMAGVPRGTGCWYDFTYVWTVC